MLNARLLIGCLCMLIATTSMAADVKYDKRRGTYSQVSTGYEVDAMTQLCFKANNPIDCVALARRPEWRKIIAWVESG